MQQAVRFALFHAVQAAARAEQRAIPAKGLTGPGYDGHCFWDTETYVLPMLTYSLPRAVADALRWRQSTLPMATERAAQLGLSGAAFPWRTIAGEECSAYWPAGTAAFHVNADIADAVIRYVEASGDETFERDTGLELLAQTARLWRSLGHHDAEGHFRIDGVTGPDEYSAIADNNVYTNLMAQRNLYGAAETAARHPHRAHDLGITEEEMAGWRDAAGAMLIPYDSVLGVHPQAEGFTEHEVWDFARTPSECYPLLLHYPYFDLYRKQVVKQADLVLALWLRGDAFTDEQKARNFEYYEALTVRDSSLSAGAQAVIAAEVGHLELAFDYLREAALLDLNDLEHNTSDGLHMAALAGSWIALIAGFGGMRDTGGTLCFAPRLPERLTRLAFTLSPRRRRLHVGRVGRQRHLFAARRTTTRDRPPRRAAHGLPGQAAGAADPTGTGSAPTAATGRSGAGALIRVGAQSPAILISSARARASLALAVASSAVWRACRARASASSAARVSSSARAASRSASSTSRARSSTAWRAAASSCADLSSAAG